ncbi:MAG: hypothetical protein IPL89_17350 [Acidobacteria bacterium]|nr:hypothetical protein [Acidobacteriota bacterium]
MGGTVKRRRSDASRALLVAHRPDPRRIAVVWAPYEFWIDGKTSHCGIDVFDFVKVDGAWRVANAMWTVEPNACSG